MKAPSPKPSPKTRLASPKPTPKTRKRGTSAKRPPGSKRSTGSVTLHRASGKYLARIPHAGKRITVGYFDTRAEAEQAIERYRASHGIN